MAKSKTFTKGRSLGDVFKWLVHPGFCLVSAKLVNPLATALDLTDPVGQPLKASGANYVFVQDLDEANAIGLLYHDKPIALAGSATSEELYAILLRGPALIDKDALPLLDVNGTAFTVATLVTAYAARDIQAQSEPTKFLQQTMY